ncbi:MAG: permease-like cell division protein FtsX [Gammaproteobacteria bacterium]|nr:permease-like cell division protein FtsX [Gammaproteobacteria bacterium]
MFDKKQDRGRGATPLDRSPKQGIPERRPKTNPAATNRPKPPKVKASGPRLPRGSTGYWASHKLAIHSARQRLQATPLHTLMTVLVIAVALSLPAALQVLITNTQQLGSGLEESAQISLFLKGQTTEGQALALQQQLRDRSDIAEVSYISREQALSEFESLSGFTEALKTLDENPLPHVLVVLPRLDQDKNSIQQLRDELSELPLVDMAQLDMAWIERLFGIIDILQRSATFLSLFLTFAVLMVVGNTIRLLSQNYRAEIEVYKLVGATDAFVRRPFLYSGLFYGLVGSLLAIFLVTLAIAWIAPSANHLAELYQSSFILRGLGISDILSVLAIGATLGLGGAWMAVNRYLKELDL